MKPFSYNLPEWKTLRAFALMRARWRCEMCGKNVAGFKRARVDHITTVKANPALALDANNVRVLCTDCDGKRHSEKGHRHVPRTPIGIDGFPEVE